MYDVEKHIDLIIVYTAAESSITSYFIFKTWSGTSDISLHKWWMAKNRNAFSDILNPEMWGWDIASIFLIT